jgi:hypothetical protein
MQTGYCIAGSPTHAGRLGSSLARGRAQGVEGRARRRDTGTHLVEGHAGTFSCGFHDVELYALARIPDLLESIPPRFANLAQRLLDLVGAFECDALGNR